MSDVSIITPGPQGPPPYRPVVAWAPFDSDAPVTFFKAPYASVVEVDGSLYECLVTHQPGSDFAVDLAAGKWRLLVSAQLTPEWQAIVDGALETALAANATALAAADATAEDAAATTADRLQVGADRVQTGIDRTAAELARDGALANGTIYATEAAGRAAVATGDYFRVAGTGTTALELRQKTGAGSSVLVTTLPSVAAITEVAERSPEPANQGVSLLATTAKTSGGSDLVDILVDDEGRVTFPGGLTQESLPGFSVLPYSAPGALILETTEDGVYVLSIREDDGSYVVLGDTPPADAAGGSTVAVEPEYSAGLDYEVRRDWVYSEWIDPLAVEDEDGNRWNSGLGRVLPDGKIYGRIMVCRSLFSDPPVTTLIGRVETTGSGNPSTTTTRWRSPSSPSRAMPGRSPPTSPITRWPRRCAAGFAPRR